MKTSLRRNKKPFPMFVKFFMVTLQNLWKLSQMLSELNGVCDSVCVYVWWESRSRLVITYLPYFL